MKRKTSFNLGKAHKLGISSTDKSNLELWINNTHMHCPIFKYLGNGRFVTASDTEDEHARWAQNMCQVHEIYTGRDQMLANVNFMLLVLAHL